MNQLKDAQANYKLALKRSEVGGLDTQSIFEGIVPSSPQSLLPGSPLSSMTDSPQLKLASTAPKDSTTTEDDSTDTLVQLASSPPKLTTATLIPDSIPSSMESSLASLTNLDPDTPSPFPYIRRSALPLTPSTRRTRTRGSIRAGRTSLSPPASPARDRRLNTLKALHEKAKSMDVMFV